MVQHEDQKPEGHRVDSCWGVFGLFFHASCVTDCTNISSTTRVPSRFNGIRDFHYLKLGIRDFKAKSGKIRDWKYACQLECPKYLSGLRDCTKLLVGITGLKNPLIPCHCHFFFFRCQNYLHRQTSFLIDVQRSVAESFLRLTLPLTNDKGSASRNLLGVSSNRYRTERTKTEYTIVDFYSSTAEFVII